MIAFDPSLFPIFLFDDPRAILTHSIPTPRTTAVSCLVIDKEVLHSPDSPTHPCHKRDSAA